MYAIHHKKMRSFANQFEQKSKQKNPYFDR